MDIRALKTFVTIFKQGSFQKAAEVLNYSKPTITLHIKSLEEQLGEKLIERGKIVKMTEIGQRFFERANAVLIEYNRLENMLYELESGEEGFIRVGISEPIASWDFPKILLKFSEHYPKVELSIQIGDGNTLHELVYNDELDFAICPLPEDLSSNYFKPIYKDEIVLLVPEIEKFASKEAINLSELTNETFIFTSQNSPIKMKIEQPIIEALGMNYKKMIVSNEIYHQHYVKAELGISPVLKRSLVNNIEGTKILKIADINITLEMGILSKDSTDYINKAAYRLLSFITDYFKNETCNGEFEIISRLNLFEGIHEVGVSTQSQHYINTTEKLEILNN